ncbi:hypothetical protein [Bradyrhizobium sp. CCBAU 53415]|uniref:hypothetical protein n=1 Tax=Bradyrhizobium sp. CCBAU 53415 TaxID=1325119 RepID=UPI0023052A67|nr:hypothetical protein [Bradyrhizobium sp. CCBAU 53415]MDA9466560.1 hypothetical protein [Bradyrhizobium sp. CCBAU 53415]
MNAFTHLTDHFRLPVPDIRAALGGHALRALLRFTHITPNALQRGRIVSDRQADLQAQLADANQENLALRREVASLKRQVAEAEKRAGDSTNAAIARLRAGNATEPSWVPFATMMKSVPRGLASENTLRAACERGEIVSRQLRGFNTPHEVCPVSWRSWLEQYAWIKGKQHLLAR